MYRTGDMSMLFFCACIDMAVLCFFLVDVTCMYSGSPYSRHTEMKTPQSMNRTHFAVLNTLCVYFTINP